MITSQFELRLRCRRFLLVQRKQVISVNYSDSTSRWKLDMNKVWPDRRGRYTSIPTWIHSQNLSVAATTSGSIRFTEIVQPVLVTRDKWCPKESPSFTWTARICIWVTEFFQIKGRFLSNRNCLNQLMFPSFSHIEQESKGEYGLVD